MGRCKDGYCINEQSLGARCLGFCDRESVKARADDEGIPAIKEMINYFDQVNKMNHHHDIKDNQTVIDLGAGKFIADNERIALLKALNDCGLMTRTHCYGHDTGHSFISILLRNNLTIEVRPAVERNADRGFDGSETELLLSWKRID